MSKNILLLIFTSAIGICSLGHNDAFAKGVYYTSINPSGPQFGQHCFAWDQWPDWATYNDWKKVGSAGYENYLILQTNTETTLDSLPRSPWPEVPDTYLYWWTDHQVAPPHGTWAGYEWTIPETGLGSNQLITGFTINGGYWNYPAGGSAPFFIQLLDGDGNVLWSYDANGLATWIGSAFPPNAMGHFPEHKTKTIRLIMNANGEPHWAWANNSAYLGLIIVFTVDDLPSCGDVVHPYPLGDFDKNCVVDLLDLQQFSLDWLECNDPNNTAQCGS